MKICNEMNAAKWFRVSQEAEPFRREFIKELIKSGEQVDIQCPPVSLLGVIMRLKEEGVNELFDDVDPVIVSENVWRLLYGKDMKCP